MKGERERKPDDVESVEEEEKETDQESDPLPFFLLNLWYLDKRSFFPVVSSSTFNLFVQENLTVQKTADQPRKKRKEPSSSSSFLSQSLSEKNRGVRENQRRKSSLRFSFFLEGNTTIEEKSFDPFCFFPRDWTK